MYPLKLSLLFLYLGQKWSCDAWLYEDSLVGRVWKNGQHLLAVSGQQQAILLSKPSIAAASFLSC